MTFDAKHISDSNCIERVRSFLAEKGITSTILELDQSTKTSQLAAQILGCQVSQIAKSIVIKGDKPYIVVISGDKKVDIQKVSQIVGEDLHVADQNYIEASTGYKIGGVPPFPHREGVKILLDISLERWGEVWTAAGSSNSVMKITVKDLKRITEGRPINLSLR
jgi:prolyl-tRNA editing enzyme YbaK/EbsC (Cys-tRNA(Pro) deacylase)